MNAAAPTPAPRLRKPYRAAGIVFVIGALAYAAFAFRRAWQVPEGSSERDQVTLVCVSCGAESIVSGQQFLSLPMDSQTRGLQCPKCGVQKAYVATLRCKKCGRAIPHTPDRPATAFVCPFCQAPMGDTPAEERP